MSSLLWKKTRKVGSGNKNTKEKHILRSDNLLEYAIEYVIKTV